MTLADLPQIQALSAQEKLQLVDELWVSAAPDLDNLEVSDETKNKLDERWANFLKDPTSALSLEQFQEKMKAFRK
jgi:putative addiction module component (TIGR02574 family)